MKTQLYKQREKLRKISDPTNKIDNVLLDTRYTLNSFIIWVCNNNNNNIIAKENVLLTVLYNIYKYNVFRGS